MNSSIDSSTPTIPVSKALVNEIRTFCARSSLTPRESEILAILAEGVVRIKDVADRLSLSPNTVNNHVNSIFMKTRTRSKSQLLAGLLNHVANELQRARYFRQSPKVAIVDREQGWTNLLTQVLEGKGCQVSAFATDEECMAHLKKGAIHFVVADIQTLTMPIAQFMKAISAVSCAQVILTSMSNGLKDRWQAMNEGAIDLLAKPVDMNQLMQVLMAHFIEDDNDRVSFLEDFQTSSDLMPKIGRDAVHLTRENLGAGGIFLSADDLRRILEVPVTIGDQLELKLRFDQVPEPIVARGQVVWSRPSTDLGGMPGVGVRFTYLARSHREKLSKFLKENQIQSYIPAGHESSFLRTS